MITVKVTYGVKKEFVAKNKENIGVFMNAFKAMNSIDFTYNVYTLDDETTFVHISSYANEHIQKQVMATPEFVEFQRQRDESGLIRAHNLEVLHSVATSN
jgi:two-component SAPR family response regulator